jgi:hypothetical protein
MMGHSKLQLRQLSHVATILVAAVCLLVPAAIAPAAATVNFEGFLYDGFNGPLWGGSVIAGTFAPGFDPTDIPCVYGDSSCNVGAEYYNLAVADGTIRPIGSFAIANSSGFFSGSGITNEPAGTPIYLFGFNPSENYSAVLATSSHAAYLVPAMGGSTSIHAVQADSFIFGFKLGRGFSVDGTPIPEPTTLTLLALTALPYSLFYRRRLRFS